MHAGCLCQQEGEATEIDPGHILMGLGYETRDMDLFLSYNSGRIMGFTFILVFCIMFSRVTPKSVSNCSWVYTDLIIGFLLILSVNSFSDTDLTLLVLLWGWWPHLSVTTKNLGDNLCMVLLFIFSHFRDLSAWSLCGYFGQDQISKTFCVNQMSLWTFWTGSNVHWSTFHTLNIYVKLKLESSKLCLCMTQIEQLGAKWTFRTFLSSSMSNYFWHNYQVHRCLLVENCEWNHLSFYSM